jgi:hypothetical protein
MNKKYVKFFWFASSIAFVVSLLLRLTDLKLTNQPPTTYILILVGCLGVSFIIDRYKE